MFLKRCTTSPDLLSSACLLCGRALAALLRGGATRCAVAPQRRNDADDAFFNTICPAHGLSSAASPIEELLRSAHFAAEAAVAEDGWREGESLGSFLFVTEVALAA